MSNYEIEDTFEHMRAVARNALRLGYIDANQYAARLKDADIWEQKAIRGVWDMQADKQGR